MRLFKSLFPFSIEIFPEESNFDVSFELKISSNPKSSLSPLTYCALDFEHNTPIKQTFQKL